MKKIVLALIILVFFGGCTQKKVRKNLLSGVSGKAGEVLLVINKNYWESETGKAFRNLLLEDVPGLPQKEPLFTLVNIPLKSFSELFRIHRNIVYVQIDKNVEKTGIKVEYNKWAKPQIFITMSASDEKSFLKLFDCSRQKVLSLLLKKEQERLMDNYKTYAEHEVIKKLEKRAAVHLTIPKGYTYDLDTNNFIWISHETPDISQGIFVYWYNYKKQSQFTADSLISRRNYFLKKYVSGPYKGTYMTTEMQVFPIFRSYMLSKKYTAELRGLWRVEGDFMGGPFVSISQIDEQRNRIVTVEGYVYAPKYNKREYIRQLEAILYTIKFLPVKDSSSK
jgi:hypothetical protein